MSHFKKNGKQTLKSSFLNQPFNPRAVSRLRKTLEAY